jgi:hypothetical protein
MSQVHTLPTTGTAICSLSLPTPDIKHVGNSGYFLLLSLLQLLPWLLLECCCCLVLGSRSRITAVGDQRELGTGSREDHPPGYALAFSHRSLLAMDPRGGCASQPGLHHPYDAPPPRSAPAQPPPPPPWTPGGL